MRVSAKVARWGNGLGVRLPKSVAAEARISAGDPVDVTVEDGAIIVCPSRTTYSLCDLVSKITECNRHGETDWGAPARAEQG